jgi:hypothetical protein
MQLERIPRALAGDRPASLNAGLAAAVTGIAIGLIAYGQYAVNRQDAPFAWPLTGWLDRRLDHAFASPTSLAFAIPLFIAGGLVFALAVPRATPPAIEHWSGRALAPRDWAIFAAVALAVALPWAWMSVRLYRDHYNPDYRWWFFGAVGAMLGIATALDARRRVFAPPPAASDACARAGRACGGGRSVPGDRRARSRLVAIRLHRR